MPSHDHCCVPMCTSRRSKCANTSFHHFPRQEQLRRRWIAAIRRDEGPHFRISSNTVVCGKHFLSSDFSPSFGGHQRSVRGLKHTAVPSVFAFTEPALVPRTLPDERRWLAAQRAVLESLPRFGPQTKDEAYEEEKRNLLKYIADLEGKVSDLRAENASLQSQLLRFCNVVKDSQQLLFYTGMDKETWTTLWNFLKPEEGGIVSSRCASERRNSAGAGRKEHLSLQDQLLMTMMRLRLGRLEQDLAYEFGISVATVSRTIDKWINFIYLRLSLLPLWPAWEDVEGTMPSAFKEAYPDTVGIIDATELKCEVPSSLSLQSQHYSPYKSHTTLKGLVAIAPNGAFTFVSELFSGSISDRAIFEESGIMNLLGSVPKGKNLMADRGFEVQDLLVKYGLLLNAPPFKGSKQSLSEEEVKKTQRIARLRIHVERAIGQVKSRFHIFDGIIPMSLYGSVNQMWSVCCIMCNFLAPLLID